MRYMMIVTGCQDFEKSGPPPTSLFEAIGKLTEESMKDGSLVSVGGLQPTSTGARLRIANGKLVRTDGPFTESKEVIGGFSIMNAASKEEAIAQGEKFMQLHYQHWPTWEGELEIRLMYEAEDDVQAVQLEADRVARLGRDARGHEPR